MYSRIISSTTSRVFRVQAMRFASTAKVAKQGRHIGESWALTEAKRIIPTFVGWATFMTTVLSWPFIINVYGQKT